MATLGDCFQLCFRDFFYYGIYISVFETHFLMVASTLVRSSLLYVVAHRDKDLGFLSLLGVGEVFFVIFEEFNIEEFFCLRPAEGIQLSIRIGSSFSVVITAIWSIGLVSYFISLLVFGHLHFLINLYLYHHR